MGKTECEILREAIVGAGSSEDIIAACLAQIALSLISSNEINSEVLELWRESIRIQRDNLEWTKKLVKDGE